MKDKLTREEQLIEFLNKKFESSNTNEVSINKHELPDLNLSEQEASRMIHLLQEEKLLTIKHKSVHDDFSRYWVVALAPSCVHYFENKKSDNKEQRRKLFNEIRAWITLIIAIAALIHSIYTTNAKSVSSETAVIPVPSVSDNQVHTP